MEYLKNKWTLLLLGFFIVFSSIILTQCNTRTNNHKEWRYEIHGYVNHNGKPHEAIWFTDTLEFGDNYLRYENSDGTEVVIPAPFILIDNSHNKVKKNNSQPFN